jgi:hypothetical protein
MYDAGLDLHKRYVTAAKADVRGGVAGPTTCITYQALRHSLGPSVYAVQVDWIAAH